METLETSQHEPGERPTRSLRRRLGRRGVVGGLVALVFVGGVLVGDVGHGLTVADAAPPPTAVATASPSGGSALQAEIENVAQRVGPAVVSIQTNRGLGSGVIYSASGLILTNAHVVAGARTITVGLADGRHFSGKVLGADPGFDLAVVKINGQNLPTAQLGNSSSLQVGQFVAAIGNPYGFDHTVTTGVVSALNRPISEGSNSYAQPMIQTDAAINPGNSGGPLVDLNGHVVGINTLVAAPQGFPAQGLGFAIPVNTAERIAPQLVQNGHIVNSGEPYLGVAVGDLGAMNAAPFPYSQSSSAQPNVSHGVLIGAVDPSGPAGKAGLRAGDVVTSFDGHGIYSANDFLEYVIAHQPGDKVTLGVVRGSQHLTITVTLGQAPAR